MFDDAKARALVELLTENDQAQLRQRIIDRPQSVIPITLDLSKERSALDPYPISFPFKSVHFAKSDNAGAEINIQPTTNDESQGRFPLKYNDAWSTSGVIPKAFLSWPAQSGTATLIFFTDSDFKSGSQIAVKKGATASQYIASQIGAATKSGAGSLMWVDSTDSAPFMMGAPYSTLVIVPRGKVFRGSLFCEQKFNVPSATRYITMGLMKKAADMDTYPIGIIDEVLFPFVKQTIANPASSSPVTPPQYDLNLMNSRIELPEGIWAGYCRTDLLAAHNFTMLGVWSFKMRLMGFLEDV